MILEKKQRIKCIVIRLKNVLSDFQKIFTFFCDSFFKLSDYNFKDNSNIQKTYI